MPKEILTVPKEAKTCPPNLLTGNEYISLPEIDPRDAAVYSVNVLHMGAKGLIEFRGRSQTPLITPYIKIDNASLPLKGRLVWSHDLYWLPTFSYAGKDLAVTGTLYFPPGHRGGVYCLTCKNTGKTPLKLEVGFRVNWQAVNNIIFSSKDTQAMRGLVYDDWTKSLLLEARTGVPLAALALGFGDEGTWQLSDSNGGQAFCGRKRLLPAAKSSSFPLYIGANMEGDGAGTTVVDLRRHGHAVLHGETKAWLGERIHETREFEALANRNLFFNYFYATGRTLDTDELIAVTSRSPRYYVSAAFWSRDTLLWSFPGLLRTDKGTAREILLRAYSHHLDKAGEHAHYINGVLLYPGFELDQLAAYFLALKSYIRSSGDEGILKEKAVRGGLPVLLQKLFARQDKRTGLFSTFLDPSDDPVRYPYLIYANALVQVSLRFLAELVRAKVFVFPQDLHAQAVRVKEAIYKHGVVSGPLGPMFAWAVDGRGGIQLYDNPPGSLQLLAAYGFCSREEVAFKNTCTWVNSSHNPYYRDEGGVVGAASHHAENPWPLAAANDLLALNMGGGEFFRQATLDNGLCCETVNPARKGQASTGFAFASAAGFVGSALVRAYANP